MEFEQGSGDDAAAEVVAAAGVAETPAEAAGVVAGAVGGSRGDERAGAAVDDEAGASGGGEFEHGHGVIAG
ncbi:MAG: hypothetical protein ABII82_02510, partial [Verrucomicrobiota bacterium]